MKTTSLSRSSDPSPQSAAASARHRVSPSRQTRHWLATAALIAALAGAATAQVPQLLNYQGRVAVGTPAVNFNGSGLFRFALVNAAGTTSYWSNDGTSSGGSQPTAAVTLTVTKGLYSVLLGDTTLANMTTAIPATVFNNADVRLRVWFNDGTNGSQRLVPDQRIAAVGYALMAGTAATVPDGAITSEKIAAGAVGSSQLAAGAVEGGNIAAGAVNRGSVSGYVSEATNDVSSAQVYIPGVSILAYVGPHTESGYPYSLINLPAGTNTITARLPSGRTETIQVVLVAGQSVSNVNFRFLRTYYQDNDGDGYGNPLVTTENAISPGEGWVLIAGDFNDACQTCYPGAPELCDNRDNDGNGQIDEGFNLQTDPNNCGSCGNVCSTPMCSSGVCEPTCTDGVKNQDETDIDCGGSYCAACADTKACMVGNDCQSKICVAGHCQAPTCTDGIKNGAESDVDCGGPCAPCADGLRCVSAINCQSGVCSGGICRAPTCTDKVKNGAESDLDCGGGTCFPCANNQRCIQNSDCTSGVCSGGICRAPTCTDGIMNGLESDVDCGGTTCAPCAVFKRCTRNSDCTSGVCVNGICQP